MKIRSVGKSRGLRKRYVYGTRTNKWYLVDKTDRDFRDGLTPDEFKKLGKKRAKEKYLSPKIISGDNRSKVLAKGQADDLLFDDGNERVWRSRIDNTISREKLKDGRWVLEGDEE